MKKQLIASILSIQLHVFSYDCCCFDITTREATGRDGLENCLHTCIMRLPGIDGLHDISFKKSIWSPELDYDEIVRFYWSHLDSFSAKDVSNLFFMLRKDYNKEIDAEVKWRKKQLENFISGKSHCYIPRESDLENPCITMCRNEINNFPLIRSEGEGLIKELEKKTYDDLSRSISYCKRYHNNPIAFYESGCLHFLQGNTYEAIDDGITFIEKVKNIKGEDLIAEIYLQQGEAYGETLQYDQAIICLTKVLETDPNNKSAYFERAVAYFELGNIDDCFQDYLSSNLKPKPLNTNFHDKISFALGVTNGAVQGGCEAFVEYGPSVMNSLQGIGNALWAFAQDPVQVSGSFVNAAYECIDYVKNNSAADVILSLVPELQRLVHEWETLNEFQKGELTGHIIGKYGVDIFAGVGAAKCLKAFRNLKKANNHLTLEAAAISKRNREVILSESLKRAEARKQVLQSSNLKVQWDKQGKHIKGHKNYMEVRSELTHPHPQDLVNKYAGKGQKVNNEFPGQPNYKERIDFNEVIGIYKDEAGTISRETTMGMIVYAKDGTHIIPIKPK